MEQSFNRLKNHSSNSEYIKISFLVQALLLHFVFMIKHGVPYQRLRDSEDPRSDVESTSAPSHKSNRLLKTVISPFRSTCVILISWYRQRSLKKLGSALGCELMAHEIGGEGESIIDPAGLHTVWTQRYFQRFYTRQHWYSSEWDKSHKMNDYIRIMSILIHIGFHDWQNFRTIFIDKSERRDMNLPFMEDDLGREDFLGDKHLGSRFYQKQRQYCPPLIIKERQRPYKLDGERLPYVDRSRTPIVLGEGGFGKVTKHTIAAGYLVYRNRGVNQTPTAVAVKTVRDSKSHKAELDNLRKLRGCLSDHKCIMVNIATIIQRTPNYDNHFLLYEVAAFDLNVFLTTSMGLLRKERNDSVAPLRNNSMDIQIFDLMEASSNLADALDYIHNRLYNSDGRLALAHNDITPANVLVVYPDSTDDERKFPAGEWKLADFGLSRPKRTREHDGSRLMPEPTYRLPSSISNTVPKRQAGVYTAPEVQQNIMDLQKIDGRQADLWSFGCVLLEVMTYATQMDNHLMKELRNLVPKDKHFYDPESKEMASSVLNFLEALPKRASSIQSAGSASSDWLDMGVTLIKEILVKDPDARPVAGRVRDGLRKIHGTTKSMKIDSDYASQEANSPTVESPTRIERLGPYGGRIIDQSIAVPPAIILTPPDPPNGFSIPINTHRARARSNRF